MSHGSSKSGGKLTTMTTSGYTKQNEKDESNFSKAALSLVFSCLPRTPLRRKRAVAAALLIITFFAWRNSRSENINIKDSERNILKNFHGSSRLEASASRRPRGSEIIQKVHSPPPPALTETETYTMVLPLVCKEVPTAQLLLSTLAAFTDPDELVAIFIVADEKDLECVREKVYNATSHIGEKSQDEYNNQRSKWAVQKIRFISSESIIPELAHVPKTEKTGRYFIPPEQIKTTMIRARSFGYIIQMLIKLAIADHVQTDYYITLDGDLLCTRTMKYRDIILFEDNTKNSTLSVKRKAVNNPDRIKNHHLWWIGSDLVLQTDGIISQAGAEANAFAMGVTPAILHRNSVIQLHRYLESLYDTPWRSSLIEFSKTHPWTEYTLYYTHAVAAGIFEKHHMAIPKREPIPSKRLYAGKNMWNPKQIHEWDWDHSFNPDIKNDGYFLVTQAALEGIKDSLAEHIVSQVKPHVPEGTFPTTLL